MGYDYEVQYKKGVEYVTIDAFSKQPHATTILLSLQRVTIELLPKVQQSWLDDSKAQEIIQQLSLGTASKFKHYSLHHQQLQREGKLLMLLSEDN